MRYDPELVQPMRNELTRLGLTELRTPADVAQHMDTTDGTTLLVINSVCGCAAQNARPAVAIATGHSPQPDRMVTAFAGMDLEATEAARAHLAGYRPSSPFIALLSDGDPVFVLERHQIEGRMATEIARDITDAYDRYCQVPA